jgi:uncharacterized protein (DUF4415 family)
MPPKTDREYASTSFTGLPSELIEMTRELADEKDVFLYNIFRDAIEDLISRLKTMEAKKYEWPLARPKTGTVPYNARMEEDVLDDMRAACERWKVKKNIFFMAALRDYLRKHGRDVEV